MVTGVAKKGVEVMETAGAGVADLAEYASAHINEPTVKALYGTARFFESLAHRASVRVEDVMIGRQVKTEKRAGFLGRIGRVLEGVNGVLEENEFGRIEAMSRAAGRLQAEASRRAAEASKRADEFRDAKRKTLAIDELSETIAQEEKKQAEERTRQANKFPRFVSQVKKLFGR